MEDSNLRSSYDDNGFRDRRIQPALPTLQILFGGAEIRTLGGVTPTTVFKTAALDHSATPPVI